MTVEKHPKSHVKHIERKLSHVTKEVEKELHQIEYKKRIWLHKLKLHHKFIFALLVFGGVILLWNGAWTVVSMIPVLNKPLVSCIVGVLILMALGYFYENIL